MFSLSIEQEGIESLQNKCCVNPSIQGVSCCCLCLGPIVPIFSCAAAAALRSMPLPSCSYCCCCCCCRRLCRAAAAAAAAAQRCSKGSNSSRMGSCPAAAAAAAAAAAGDCLQKHFPFPFCLFLLLLLCLKHPLA